MKIEDYIKIYKNFLYKDICQQTVKELSSENATYSDTGFYNVNTNTLFRTTDNDSDFFSSNYLITTQQAIQNNIYFAIEQYIKKDFVQPYFCSWMGCTTPRFNRYKENKVMSKHADHIHGCFDGERKGIPVISIIGALNDNYEGGELIFFDNHKIDLKAGDVVVFPSNFLYPHRVDKVTKGTRYSYAAWAW
jgi:predicted 2-oxoglutarate/Fe(II)-dependent dioxygenase YbiX